MIFLLKYWKPLAVVLACMLLLATVFGWGMIKGRAQIQAKWDKAKAAQQAADTKEANRQAVVTIETVTKYVDRVRVVKGKTETIIKEVPKYVTVKADADCIINTGFVRLHDAAAANTLPDGPRDTDAAPAPVTLSTVSETVSANYGACFQNAAQLDALQDWARSIGAAHP